MKEENPDFDPQKFGFQEFTEFLNFAQDKLIVRLDPDEEKGLTVFLGGEFYPPAPPPKAPKRFPANTTRSSRLWRVSRRSSNRILLSRHLRHRRSVQSSTQENGDDRRLRSSAAATSAYTKKKAHAGCVGYSS